MTGEKEGERSLGPYNMSYLWHACSDDSDCYQKKTSFGTPFCNISRTANDDKGGKHFGTCGENSDDEKGESMALFDLVSFNGKTHDSKKFNGQTGVISYVQTSKTCECDWDTWEFCGELKGKECTEEKPCFKVQMLSAIGDYEDIEDYNAYGHLQCLSAEGLNAVKEEDRIVYVSPWGRQDDKWEEKYDDVKCDFAILVTGSGSHCKGDDLIDEHDVCFNLDFQTGHKKSEGPLGAFNIRYLDMGCSGSNSCKANGGKCYMDFEHTDEFGSCKKEVKEIRNQCQGKSDDRIVLV